MGTPANLASVGSGSRSRLRLQAELAAAPQRFLTSIVTVAWFEDTWPSCAT